MITKPNINFIENFKSELNKSSFPELLIDYEINQIEAFTSSNHIKSRQDNFTRSAHKTNSVFDLSPIGNRNRFNYMFFEFIKNGSYEINENTANAIFEEPLVEVVKKFVEYYKWLKNLRSEYSKKTPLKKKSIPHKQKMLMLYYLGLDLNLGENTSIAKVISLLLELDFENTRKYLSYVSAGKNEVRTKKNLTDVMNIFQDSDLINVSKYIESEIIELK